MNGKTAFYFKTGRKWLASQFNFTYKYIDDVLSINNPDFENYLGQMCPPELEIKDTTESNTSASYLDLLLSIGRYGQLHTSLYDKRDDFNFHITNVPFLSSNIPSSPPMAFLSHESSDTSGLAPLINVLFWGRCDFQKLLRQGYVKERLRSSQRKFFGRYGDPIKQYEVSLSRMLHDILDDDHLQWHPPLIRHYTNFDHTTDLDLTTELNFLTKSAACQQRTLTPPDTWSCPTLWIASFLMLRPISPELVLFPDFWVSNIPLYFCVYSYTQRILMPWLLRCTNFILFKDYEIRILQNGGVLKFW